MKILANIIGESSKKYNTKEKMSYKKDMLYGASIICDSSDNGDFITFKLNYSFLNLKYSKIEQQEYLDFLKEIIYNCQITNELVEENKRLLIDTIKRALEKPNILAKNNAIKIIAEDDPSVDASNIDIIDDIATLDLDYINKTYDEIVNESDVVSCIYGDLLEDIICGFKELKLGGDIEYHAIEKKSIYNPKQMIVEEKAFSQSSLLIFYSNPINCFSDNNDLWIVGDMLLGGLPTSLLFEEVREKMSLCYDISVNEFVCHGISYIKTNIDGKNTNLVIEECNKQIQRIINKDYDISILESTKELIINSFIQSQDDFEICAKRYYSQYLSNRYRTIEERIDSIRKITVDDVSSLFKNYKPYFIYLLKGIKNEENI